jgi:serine/threonine-protein kinase
MPNSCPNCGTPVTDDAIFCHRCGRNFTLEIAAARPPADPADLDTLARLRAALADRYAIERELGRGGMATVFLAKDLKHEREVAIKVLHPELAASLGAERFEREIRLAAKLQHPHILGLFDSGAADGLLYYVMPFVKGESLRDRLDREGMLPVDDAVGITLEVCDALGYAHSQGVVHRDIKPENILLSGGHALVADFGIARAVTGGGAQKLTQTGMSMGTPFYMAPEQASGETVGPTADIYSLGCMLYEMLAGEPPFTGQNSLQIMARHAMEQVPSIRIVRSAVPEEIEQAIFAALGKVPADRPQTAAQFAELMGMPAGSTASMRAMGITPTGSRRFPSASRAMPAVPAERPWWRRPLVFVPVVLAVLGLGGFAGYRLLSHSRAGTAAGDVNPRSVGVLYFADQSKDGALRYLADGLTESLIDALSQVSVLDVVSRNGVRPFRGTEVSADSIARALHVASLVRGAVEPSSKGVKVTVRLVDAASDVDIAHTSIEFDTSKVLAARDSVAGEVSRFLREHLGREVRLKESRLQAGSADAWTLVQRAEKRRKDADSLLAAAQLGPGLAALGDADGMLVRAAATDPKWVEPMTMRAAIAYRRARALRDSVPRAKAAVDSGLTAAERALAVDPRNADALELRGKLRYLRFNLHVVPEGPESDRLLDAAEKDLRAAVEQNPAQAGAWVTLSALAYRRQNPTEGARAAQSAYKADAYLSNAPDILKQLFWTSHDTELFPEAAKWCAEGRRRFPRAVFFTECRLWMLTTKYVKPDPDEAWRLYDSLKVVTPAATWPYEGRVGQVIVGAVLARAGLADSARRVLVRARTGTDVDPVRELVGYEAVARVMLHDYDEAARLIEQYLAVHPDHRKGFATMSSWWWRDPGLQNNPRFKALIAGAR